jgi:hypothetical protein
MQSPHPLDKAVWQEGRAKKKIMEKSKIDTQKINAKFQRIQSQILDRKGFFAAHGSVETSWRIYRNERLGPYYRVVFREQGSRKSIYLGRNEILAQRVVGLLAELQSFQRQRRLTRRLRAIIRVSLRREKAKLEEMLAPLGFRMKGFAFHRRRSQFREEEIKKFPGALALTTRPRLEYS